MKNLTPRELATVLAALRWFQHTTDTAEGYAVPFLVKDHFNDTEPMFDKEIDALCEKINVEEPTDNDWFGFSREDVTMREELMRDNNDLDTDEPFAPLSHEEREEVWKRFRDKDFYFEVSGMNEQLDDIIRNVVTEREDGTSGQDRESYSDEQDRESYTTEREDA